jgi:hypothetical protein
VNKKEGMRCAQNASSDGRKKGESISAANARATIQTEPRPALGMAGRFGVQGAEQLVVGLDQRRRS